MAKQILSFIIITALALGTLWAQDLKMEVKEQVPIILKALNYNNTLKEKIRNDCVIAVLYNPQSALSEDQKKLIVDVLNDNKKIKVHKKKIKIVEIPMDYNVNLEKKIIIRKINAFWLTTGLQPFIKNIRESARYNQVITLSSDPKLVSSAHVAMGTQKTEAGHKLIINMNEAHKINVELNKSLFSEAIVVK
jgi:hypothetical protein